MIILTLQRDDDNEDGLFGVLFFGSKELVTIERNRGGKIKPIPQGIYKIVPHSGTRWKGVVALVNEALGVYHWPIHPNTRSAILIHPANFQSQLLGCIALGDKRTQMRDKRMKKIVHAISNSANSVKEFMLWYNEKRLVDNDIRIDIRD